MVFFFFYGARSALFRNSILETRNFLHMFYIPEYLQSVISLAALRVGISVRPEDVSVEVPADMAHGDYATNIALASAKEAGKNPRELGAEIAAHMADTDSEGMVADVSVAGPGFINITLAKSVILSRLIHAMEEKYGYADEKTGETVVVEYTDPNPFKPFHIGHLMTNIIGESLARLLEAEGDTVVRMNYQGDVGLHIAKALYGMKELGVSPDDIEGIGKAYAYGNTAYEDDAEAKVAIETLNEHVYARDDEVLNALYDAGRTTSLAHFEELYQKLGTVFDAYVFESETWKKGKDAVEVHVGDVFAESDGAIVYHGEDEGLHTRVFINAKGLPTYEAKDIGLAMVKIEKYPEAKTYYTITAEEQTDYFKVVFAALAKMDPKADDRFSHIAHGMMRLSDGKMSSRKGNVITGESLLEEVTARAAEKLKENGVDDDGNIANMVAVAALKYGVLRGEAGRDIVYNPEQWLSFEGASGPYVQYTATRAASVVAKAKEAGIAPSLSGATDEIDELERLIARFPEDVREAARLRMPHKIATVITNIAQAFNAYYAQTPIVSDAPEAPYRVALAKTTASTLESGLSLLGISVPERM